LRALMFCITVVGVVGLDFVLIAVVSLEKLPFCEPRVEAVEMKYV